MPRITRIFSGLLVLAYLATVMACDGQNKLWGWSIAALVLDIISIVLGVIASVIAPGYTGAIVAGLFLVISAIVGIVVASYVLCCSPNKGVDKVQLIGGTFCCALVLAIIGMFCLAARGEMCIEKSNNYCHLACAKIPEVMQNQMDSDDKNAVKAGSAYICTQQRYISGTMKCSGSKWCWRADADCDGGDDDDHYWAFDTEDECYDNYRDLQRAMGASIVVAIIGFICSAVSRIGIITTAFICPPEEAAVAVGGLQHMPGAAVVVGVGTVLPPGWAVATDPATGSTYYYNVSTGESQYELPNFALPVPGQPTPPPPPPAGLSRETPAPAPAPTETPAPTPAPAVAAAAEILPAGWGSATDPNTGQTYYYNEATGESQFELPCPAKQS